MNKIQQQQLYKTKENVFIYCQTLNKTLKPFQ